MTAYTCGRSYCGTCDRTIGSNNWAVHLRSRKHAVAKEAADAENDAGTRPFREAIFKWARISGFGTMSNWEPELKLWRFEIVGAFGSMVLHVDEVKTASIRITPVSLEGAKSVRVRTPRALSTVLEKLIQEARS